MTNILDTFKHWVSIAEVEEQWIVLEIHKAQHALETAAVTAEADVLAIFKWISTHQQNILNVLTDVEKGLLLVGSIMPQTAGAVAAATLAINASTAAINVLAKGIQAGSTPIGTIAAAYVSVKDAQTAVNTVLKAAAAAK